MRSNSLKNKPKLCKAITLDLRFSRPKGASKMLPLSKSSEHEHESVDVCFQREKEKAKIRPLQLVSSDFVTFTRLTVQELRESFNVCVQLLLLLLPYYEIALKLLLDSVAKCLKRKCSKKTFVYNCERSKKFRLMMSFAPLRWSSSIATNKWQIISNSLDSTTTNRSIGFIKRRVQWE